MHGVLSVGNTLYIIIIANRGRFDKGRIVNKMLITRQILTESSLFSMKMRLHFEELLL